MLSSSKEFVINLAAFQILFAKFEACSNYPECKYIKSEKKKAEPVMTDEVCPNCGSPVVIKKGRWGEFKACSNYPKCKTIIK